MPNESETQDSLMISVVIPTYNRASTLRRTLDSFYALDGLDGVPCEVIVVDNNSSDDTPDVVRSFAGPPAPRYVFEARQGLSHARNRGAAEAHGDVVALLDDDVILDKAWLTALHRCFEETGAHAVGGPSYLILEAEAPPWMGADFRRYLSEVNLGAERRPAGDGRNLFGLNLAIKRKAIEICGGFRDALGRKGGQLLCGEERDLLRRIRAEGGKIYYEPNAVVGHLVGPERLTWEYFIRLAVGAGQSRALLDRPAGRLVRMGRVLDTSAKLMGYSALALLSELAGSDRYAHRALCCRTVRVMALLPERWDALVHSAADETEK